MNAAEQIPRLKSVIDHLQGMGASIIGYSAGPLRGPSIQVLGNPGLVPTHIEPATNIDAQRHSVEIDGVEVLWFEYDKAPA